MNSRIAFVASFASLALLVSGCTVTAEDTSDASTDTGPGIDTGPGGDTNGTDTAPSDGGVDSSTTDTGGADVSWVPPPDSTAYYVRFVVATSDFTAGTPYDVCYLPWDGVTAPAATDTYTGPVADAYGGYFTAPEVSNYFKLNLDSSHKTVRVRLVAKGSDCSVAAKFHITVGGTDHIVSVEDDVATFQVGYNTAIVYGNVDASSSYKLSSIHDVDPTAAPSVATLQFFNGYAGGLSLTLTATDGTLYSLSTGAIPFKSYVSLPFTTATSTGSEIHIAKVTFDPGGGGAPVDIGLTDYTFGIGYFWAFSYGNSTDGLHFYLCGDSLKTASSGDVAVSGCILK